MSELDLNSKGQCPHCLKKPLKYKRQGYRVCIRCGAQFRLTEPNFICWSSWSTPENPRAADYRISNQTALEA
ncbi:hypothetical protein [Ensifer adhaerens]|jgi:hypothetical protein|uniref:hypothetical protein n=1 Tax=Ensifer adhaerens TaxID=106592 RepID=UPI002030BC8A|nr:hypothetical protein [Ensifer adhaerens]